MRGVRLGFGASRGDVVRLFEGDSVVGLDEGELLARFVTRRDEAAFEALVTRLGPMVLGVARRMLSDPHDVDDAFQATFLVLVKKAESIRDRDLVAPWLHGVASKVARRARAESARRKAREKLATVPEAVEDSAMIESGWVELRALIDEEIERLPESHRRAVVLCDVEGLSREEAALRLGWSLNMVRGRLERARGRLRGRLARRGVAPSGAWMALMVAPPVPSPSLLSHTIRASLAFSSGRMATGLASASAVALSRGVLRMMMLSKLKVGLVVLLSAGFVAGGSGMLAAQRPGDKPGVGTTKVVVEDPPAQDELKPVVGDPFRPRTAAELAEARVQVARRRYKALLDSDDGGNQIVGPLVVASRAVMEAECDAAGAKAARVEAVQAHYDRIKEMLKRKEAEVLPSPGQKREIDETKEALLDAEFALAKELEAPEAPKPARGDAKAGSKPPAATRTSLDQQRVEIARRIYDQARTFHVNARVESSVALEAAVTLANAEEGAARTKADRVAACRAQVDRLKEIIAVNEARVQAARGTNLDVDQARLRLLEAESHLLDVSSTPDGATDAVAPASGGSIPASGPRASKGSDSRALSPLAKAIEAFNAEATRDEFGRDQPPLTEDEVIAAVRIWKPEHGMALSKELQSTLDAISESRRWPEGVELASFTHRDNGKGFLFFGWCVRIQIRNPRAGRVQTILVRDRLIRSETYEEALAKAKADILVASSPEDRSRLEKTITVLEQQILEKRTNTLKQESAK
jgi:RNA polymerase sigma factor (sigma-70 family)